MTTSEFIIGHSVDDATDRKAEAHKILWALLVALVIHLIIGCGIAAFSGVFSSPIQVEEDKPMEMTMVDLSTPPPIETQKNTMFMETDESKASQEAPKEKTFESNANSIAASQLPAQGGMPLPSQEGQNRPTVDLESHAYSLPNEGAQPQPSVAPKETPQPSATPLSTPKEADQLAMLTNTPKPTPQPTTTPTPAPVRSKYQQMKQQTRSAGSITNRGISAVNALGTPFGRYEKEVMDAIGSRWYSYIESKGESANVGDVVVHFRIDRSGHLYDLKIIENTSNETFANICLQAIQDSPFRPIPDDVAAALPPEGFEMDALRFSMIPR